MIELTRPSHDDVQLFVYLATRDKDHPTTLADIHLLGRSYYMHELTRAVWQLVEKGTLAVQSGNIKNIEEFHEQI
ncbi:hypothetical protein SCRM01_099c [Synechococcus phage S-CRM01]|uniref:hypothetical protein n=1 Tax=Synechococcus phage S-CRM01 TaxID=1026955 RepID=UPI000209E39F|nr:hypothetical protein SCRM01_099c [Synechococcus phage S-CRM01]AEC53045.1 hypothetical protein SCRM01_099c [Synechococcus phage S-CRM01]